MSNTAEITIKMIGRIIHKFDVLPVPAVSAESLAAEEINPAAAESVDEGVERMSVLLISLSVESVKNGFSESTSEVAAATAEDVLVFALLAVEDGRADDVEVLAVDREVTEDDVVVVWPVPVVLFCWVSVPVFDV